MLNITPCTKPVDRQMAVHRGNMVVKISGMIEAQGKRDLTTLIGVLLPATLF
jgi:hypothetical protein